MKTKTLLIPMLLLLGCMLVFSSCSFKYTDPYKDYEETGIEVKSIPGSDNIEGFYKFGLNRVERFTSYENYSEYNFNLDYTEGYFELNDLVVFTVRCCSSDEMNFGEILANDGILYPMFYRKKIAAGQAVTDDLSIIARCFGISKASEYEIGEIIFRYK